VAVEPDGGSPAYPLCLGAVIERRPQALSALVSMAAVITAMAGHLGERDRIALSEILRDSADEIERRRVVVRVE
jgi:hypothetical protein